MGVMIGVMVFVGGILASIFLALLVDDTKEWLKWAIDRLVERAVHRSPQSYQSRLSEEWHSHIAEIPGYIGKIFVALQFTIAAYEMRKGLSIATRPDQKKQRALDSLTVETLASRASSQVAYLCRAIFKTNDFFSVADKCLLRTCLIDLYRNLAVEAAHSGLSKAQIQKGLYQAEILIRDLGPVLN